MHSFGEYDMPKISGKMSDKSFLSKGKNKAKISPIVNACSEQVSSSSASPLGLNVCFGKKLLRSPSNSQTLEFNDRSSEGREGAGEGVATCPRSVAVPRSHGSVYGRLGNTYGRLHVLGSGIGRIERHLSSSCGNIDHYCTAPTQGNPRFRIENQSVEADRIYQHIESTVEEAPAAAPPPGIKGISKGSLQWLMVNRWLPLWVANSGGKNEYKVIDVDFSIYDDVRYPMCTAACADEHCMGRNAEAYSLYRRNYLGAQLSLGREHGHGVAGPGTSPSANRCAGFGAEPFPNEDSMAGASGNIECDSPEPDSSSGENYVVDNEQDLSTADNEPSVSECSRSAAEGSSSSEGSSPAPDTNSSQPTPTPTLPLQTNHSA